MPGLWKMFSKYVLDEWMDNSGDAGILTQVCLGFRRINITCEKIPQLKSQQFFP